MLKKIDSILRTVRTQLKSGQQIRLVFPANKTRKFIFSFPGHSFKEARDFTLFVRVLEIIASNLAADKRVPVRDIYYLDVELFKDQQTVVRVVDRICALFSISRDELNVIQSPSGLVSGDLSIALTDSSVVEISWDNGPSLIPVGEILYVMAARRPNFILVVEKEAVFSNLHTQLDNAILITGKGFPDHATRRLLVALQLTYPQVPCYILVDSDPHGILIVHTYETMCDMPVSLEYLGVSILDYEHGLVDTTITDKRIAMCTLKKRWIHEPKYMKCKIELQRGLFMCKKGELNLIDKDHSSMLGEYVNSRIERHISDTYDENEEYSQRVLTNTEQSSVPGFSRSMRGSTRVPSRKRPRSISDYVK